MQFEHVEHVAEQCTTTARYIQCEFALGSVSNSSGKRLQLVLASLSGLHAALFWCRVNVFDHFWQRWSAAHSASSGPSERR